MNPPKEDDSSDSGNENNSSQRITSRKQEAKEQVTKLSEENGPFDDDFKNELENMMSQETMYWIVSIITGGLYKVAPVATLKTKIWK